MSWFGLFDRLRLRAASTIEGWPMPGSRLRLTEANLASFYRSAILAEGAGFTADLFDIAGHELARRWTPSATQHAAHLDIRLAGRAQRILFAGDAGQNILSWFAPGQLCTLRIDAADLTLQQTDLWPLLEETLGLTHVPTLTLWAEDVATAGHVLTRLAPLLSSNSVALLRLPARMVQEALAACNTWPARCAAVIPCTGAADTDGRGEEPADVILCLESLSTRIAGAETLVLQPIQRPIWNAIDRAGRLAGQGGVTVRQPLPERILTSGWTMPVIGDVPLTPAGLAVAGLQATPFRAQAGFDHVIDVQAATVFQDDGLVVVLPQTGPVVIAPALLREADAVEPASNKVAIEAAARRVLQARGLLGTLGFAAARGQPIRRFSDRTAFLLTGDWRADVYISEIWPTLEYLFQSCETTRTDIGTIDLLLPGVALDSPTGRLMRDSLLILGFDAERIHAGTQPSLYRHVIMTTPASSAVGPQRSSVYDQFWQRVEASVRIDAHVSFTRPRRSDRLMLRSRTGTALLNAPALEAIARRWGYEIVEPEALSLNELISVMAQAKSVIGTAAALTWACLCRQGTLGGLMSDQEDGLPFAALNAAASRGLGVMAAFGTTSSPAARGSFSLAPDRFEALLTRIGGRATAKETAA
jgi:hypothetical protein